MNIEQHSESRSTSRTHEDRSSVEEESAEQESCPECNGEPVPQAGELVCQQCGLVVDEHWIDHGPEWRSFSCEDESERKRVGSPLTELHHDKGLSTKIGWSNRDGNGNVLSSKKRAKLQRLRTQDVRSKRTGSDRGLAYANGEIQRMASALGLPKDIQETAAVILRRAQAEELVIGRSLEGCATAALYAASRQHGVPRTLDRVTRTSRLQSRERIFSTYQSLNRRLSLKVDLIEPRDLIPQITSDLGIYSQDIGVDIERIAANLVDEARCAGIGTGGMSPTVLAATAVYVAAATTPVVVTQAHLSSIADTTKASIRNHYPDVVQAAECIDAPPTRVRAKAYQPADADFDVRTEPCAHCDEEFTTELAMEGHEKSTHPNRGP